MKASLAFLYCTVIDLALAQPNGSGMTQEEVDELAEEHDHYVDPSMDGSCIACVGARRIYCMDGLAI